MPMRDLVLKRFLKMIKDKGVDALTLLVVSFLEFNFNEDTKVKEVGDGYIIKGDLVSKILLGEFEEDGWYKVKVEVKDRKLLIKTNQIKEVK